MTYHLFSMTDRKAVKQHQCVWCGEIIAKGDAYLDERSVYDGSIQRNRWHPECLEAARQGWRDGDDAEFCPGEHERPGRIEVQP